MQIAIRKLSLEDAEVLAQISRTTFYDTFSGTCTEEDMEQFLDQAFNLPQLQAELADENDLYFFAEINGKAAGYLRMMEDYSGFDIIKKWKSLEVKRIYVDKIYHGKGIAQLLIQFAEDYALKNNYEVLWLGVWEHNTRANKFYEKSGFTDTGFSHDFPIGSTPQTDKYLWKFFKQDSH